MEYLRENLRYFANYFQKRVEENKGRKVSKYEIYFEKIFKVLSWEDTSSTLFVFLEINLLFWVIVQWQINFFGIVFFIMLSLFIWDSFIEPRRHTVYDGRYIDTFDEISSWFHDIFLNMKTLRKESPSSFCIGMSLVFLFMSFIAKNLSGYLIAYLIVLGIFFIPLGFQFIPAEYTIYIKQIFKPDGCVRGVLAEEELIPFICNKNFGSKDVDLDSLLTDKTADSATNSLASGMSTMPSYLDIGESQNDIQEEDLMPSCANHEGVSYTPGELSSDSDSDHREIGFDSAHFNGDTSSSEEEKLLGKGLTFAKDFTDASSQSIVARKTGLSGVLTNIAAMGSTLVANALKSAPVERKNSSSDSEFEIINSEDVGDK